MRKCKHLKPSRGKITHIYWKKLFEIYSNSKCIKNKFILNKKPLLDFQEKRTKTKLS